MDKLKLYTVVKPSTDGSIQIGDIIWLSNNGDLNSTRDKGWLSKEEWNVDGTNDFEVEVCKTHYLDVFNGMECVRKIQNKSGAIK